LCHYLRLWLRKLCLRHRAAQFCEAGDHLGGREQGEGVRSHGTGEASALEGNRRVMALKSCGFTRDISLVYVYVMQHWPIGRRPPGVKRRVSWEGATADAQRTTHLAFVLLDFGFSDTSHASVVTLSP